MCCLRTREVSGVTRGRVVCGVPSRIIWRQGRPGSRSRRMQVNHCIKRISSSLFTSHSLFSPTLFSPRLHIPCVSPSSQVRIVLLESTARLAAFLPKANAKTVQLGGTTMRRGGVVLKDVKCVPPAPSTNSAARQASPHARAALSGSIRMNLESRPVRLPPARGVHGGRSFQIVRLTLTCTC